MLAPNQAVATLKSWTMPGQTVYGPIWSRRFRLSLGINLSPGDRKACNFDCLYCQCGWTDRRWMSEQNWAACLPALAQIEGEVAASFQRLSENAISPDWIVFSGNGEPTLHPAFSQAVAVVEKQRDAWLPESRLGILTNGTGLLNQEVFQAVCRMLARVIKLDAGLEWMNRPFISFDLEKLIPVWGRLSNVTIQSFFCEGRLGNTGEEDVALWIQRIRRIRPRRVQIYTLDRQPAALEMKRASLICMTRIARELINETGVEVTVFE